jgi:hypothetical protein
VCLRDMPSLGFGLQVEPIDQPGINGQADAAVYR